MAEEKSGGFFSGLFSTIGNTISGKTTELSMAPMTSKLAKLKTSITKMVLNLAMSFKGAIEKSTQKVATAKDIAKNEGLSKKETGELISVATKDTQIFKTPNAEKSAGLQKSGSVDDIIKNATPSQSMALAGKDAPSLDMGLGKEV